MATPTKAQTFYPTTSTDDQAFTGEATIRALEETNPASNATTIARWTTTTNETRTFIPFTTTTTNSDTSANNGWAFENTTTDALNSVTGDLRIVPAGVWQLNMNISTTATPLLSTRAGCAATWTMYRVAAGGGTRTALFSAVSANIGAGTAIVTINSASQPKITLAAGEVMMMGITIFSAAFRATVLGAATTMDLILNINNTSLVVPSPGIRTESTRSFDLIGTGTPTRLLNQGITATLIGRGTVTESHASTLTKTFTVIGKGDVTVAKNTQAQRTFSLVGVGVPTRVVAVATSKSLTGTGVPTFTRSANIFKSFNLIGKGTTPRDALVIIFLERTVTGKGVVTFVKASQIARTFDLIGYGQIPTTGPNATTITVPIDDLPDGGIVAANTYIFPILD